MRSGIIFLVSTLPLGLLAFSAARELPQPPPEQARPLPEPLAKPSPTSQTAKALADRWQPILESLLATDVFSPAAAPLPPPDALNAEWGRQWRQWKQAWETAQAAARVFQRPRDLNDLGQVRSAIADLEAFKSDHEFTGIPAGDRLLTLVSRRIQGCQARARQLEADSLLGRAKTALHDKQFAQCLELCNTLTAQFADITDAAQCDALKNVAQFSDNIQRLAANRAAIDAQPTNSSVAERLAQLADQRKLLEEFALRYQGAVDARAAWLTDDLRDELVRKQQELHGVAEQIHHLEAQQIEEHLLAAYQQREFVKCQDLCAQLLRDYADVADVDRYKLQKQGAGFWERADKLRAEIAAVDAPQEATPPPESLERLTRKQLLLKTFLDDQRETAVPSAAWVHDPERNELGTRETEYRKVGDQIHRVQAAQLEKDFRLAWDRREFAKCRDACDVLLRDYRDVLDASEYERAKSRAIFWDQADKLRAAIHSLGEPSEAAPPAEAIRQLELKRALLKPFVDGYRTTIGSGRAEATDVIQQEYSLRQQQLGELAQRITRLEKEQEIEKQGLAAATDLLSHLPQNSITRLERASRIAEQYPLKNVSAALRRHTAEWLAAAVPEKTVHEGQGISEGKSSLGLVRGYISEHPAGVYTVYDKPAGAGGRVLATIRDEKSFSPSESAPRRWAGQYQEARRKLLAAPGDRANWEQFARGCSILQDQLDAWLKQDWFSREAKQEWVKANRDLSFQKEAEFARGVTQSTSYGSMLQLLRP